MIFFGLPCIIYQTDYSIADKQNWHEHTNIHEESEKKSGKCHPRIHLWKELTRVQIKIQNQLQLLSFFSKFHGSLSQRNQSLVTLGGGSILLKNMILFRHDKRLEFFRASLTTDKLLYRTPIYSWSTEIPLQQAQPQKFYLGWKTTSYLQSSSTQL